MSTSEQVHKVGGYVCVVKPCGCFGGVTVQQAPDEVADFLAEWPDGCRVRVLDRDGYLALPWTCDDCGGGL